MYKFILSPAVRNMLAATFYFALMNVFIKKMSTIPPMELVFFRCFISMAFCYSIIYRERLDWRGSNRTMLIARGVAGTVGIYTYFINLQQIPLATAVTIQYTSPIFTTLIAAYILGERVKPMQYLFFALSFSGVLLIKGFDEHIRMSYLAIGLFSAIASGVAYNLVRSLREREHPIVVVLHFQLVGVVVGLVGCLLSWKMPQGIEWLYLFLTGLLAQLGQAALTKSLQAEQVGIISSLNYVGILYAIIFGVYFFGESYIATTLWGIVLVVVGVVLNVIFGNKEPMKIMVDE